MNEGYPYWLSKQMLSGVRRFDIDSFLVALEGWRRGLSLKFYYEPSTETDLKVIGYNQIGKSFSLSSGEKTHYFYRTRGDKVANEATDIGTDKAKAKEYLMKANVPTPEGFTFNKAMETDTVVKKALDLGFPLVIKPTLGSLGKGVVTDIKTEEYLRDSIAYCFTEFDYEDFIIERHVEGEDVRVYVIQGEVVAAIKRTPANVTGDGTNSIDELIDQKNEQRKLNLQTSTRLIKKDTSLINFMNQQNITLEYIPEKGETIYLKGQSNISSGGDSVDTTDDIPIGVKKNAVQAVKEIPGLNHAGIDLIVNNDGAFIIEINSTAGISLHAFPVYGKEHNVAENIIDFYFPDTKGKAAKSTKIYFDYKQILELLRSNSVKQLEVSDAPVGKLYAKRYVVSGKVQKVGYRKWIQNQAIAKGLHGYTRNLNNGKVVVVVAGVEKDRVDEFKQLCSEGPKNSKVTDVEEYIWDKQIRIGFEIRKQKKKR